MSADVSGLAFVPAGGLAASAATVALPLDAVLGLAREGGVREALDGLNRAMAAVRRHADGETWRRAIADARAHALREFVHREPFTFRCFAKPRGYAGDGAALDYVLRRRELTVRASDPLAELHHYTTHGALARALLHRRDLVASLADDVAFRSPVPIRIFAAGGGHLRECDRMRALAEGRVERIVAFDSDGENLEAARRDYGRAPIVAHLGTVRQLVEGRHLFGDLHFVHAGALVDTLPQPQAADLMHALFAMLQPGGTLLMSALLEGLPEAGFVEAYMDWRIAYRSRAALEALAAELPEDAVESVTYLENPERTLGAIAIQRRSAR